MINVAIVTGCAGFIGINLTKSLLAEGWYVYGIDKLTYAANADALYNLKDLFPSRLKIEHSDIADVDWLPEADVIFNLAAESDVDRSNANACNFVRSNVSGVQNLLDLVVKSSDIKAYKPLFVQISTDEVYGDLQTGSFSEKSALNPSNPYAATKAAADLLIQSYHRTHGVQYQIIRPSNNYGEFQYPEKLIPLSIKRIKAGKLIKLHNQGTPIRTWTHVNDTVAAIRLIYNSGLINGIYNVSSGYEQSNLQTVQKILNAYFGKQVDINSYIDCNYNRAGQDVRYSISCEPLKKLGWAPKANFDKEVHKLIKFYDRFIW